MRLVSFQYQQDGWVLDPVTFGQFDLLVGLSGAGKSKIVKAIERVCAVALGDTDWKSRTELLKSVAEAEFAIQFEHDDLMYQWEAALGPLPDEFPPKQGAAETPLILHETLHQGERVLVRRDKDQFLFQGQPLPRLDRGKSAIALLKEDPAIRPLFSAFERCMFRELESLPSHGVTVSSTLEEYRAKESDLASIGAKMDLPLHHRAYYIYQLFPDAFKAIEASFQSAFPSVKSLRVGVFNKEMVNEREVFQISLVIEEFGVPRLIPFHEMSSGMQRYLSFLVHLSFAPRGTVVLIDEIEASFGVNCLPAATDFLLNRTPDIQFIVTSHHPYIIDKIPPRYWKLVTRRGCRVKAVNASDIPALAQGKSHLDNFSRLINLPEYEHGIQGEPS